MKVLFGTNITENRKNTDTDCKELIIRTVPESYYDSFDEDAATENVSSDGKKRLKRLTKAVFLILLRIMLGVAAFASLAGVMVSIGEESEGIKDVIFSVKDNLLLFVSSSAVLCVSLLLLYRIKSAERKAQEKAYSEIDEKNKREDEEYEREVNAFLGVPPSAQTVEVISADYKIKNENVYLKPGIITLFFNNEIKMFTKNKTLYLADEENCYSLSLEGEKKIFKIEDRLTLLCWNKEQSYKEGKFKEFGIKRTPVGNYIIKEYYFLEVNISGEKYRLYFPPYELKKIISITGAKVQE